MVNGFNSSTKDQIRHKASTPCMATLWLWFSLWKMMFQPTMPFCMYVFHVSLPFLSSAKQPIQLIQLRCWNGQKNIYIKKESASMVFTATWQQGCAWVVTVGDLFGVSQWTRRRRKREAPGRRGLARANADPAAAGCVVCDDEGGGGGGDVRKRSARCAVVGLTLSADHCRWSTGSPAKSSYHSPGPLNRRHPLVEPDKKEHVTE